MSTRLDIPILSGPLDASTVNAWLNICQDSFEVHAAINDSTYSPSVQIVLAGIKMEAPAARSWWNENRDELKALTSWEDFAKKVKERFVPTNWKMDALSTFYEISQGPSSFSDYATKLQEARNTLSSGGPSFAISDPVFKNHLLFFCHPILSLRIRSIPGLNYTNTRVDALVSLMTSTWDSLVAEGVIRRPASTLVPSQVRLAGTQLKPFIPLTEKEREALKLAGGCFRCRRTPASPGWIQHGSRNCPDTAYGISPAHPRPIGAVMDSDLKDSHVVNPAQVVASTLGPEDEDDETKFVATVFPSYILGNESFSEGEEEDDSWS